MTYDEQRAREFRQAAIAGTEDEAARWWTSALSRQAPGEPAPEPSGPTAEQIAAMTNDEWQSARTALGLRQTRDLEGSHWEDRRSEQIKAQNLAAKGQPDALPAAPPITERKPFGSTIFGADTVDARIHQSPWSG